VDVAAITALVDQARGYANQVADLAKTLPDQLRSYAADAKKYYDLAEAARTKIPTLEELQALAQRTEDAARSIQTSNADATKQLQDMQTNIGKLQAAVDEIRRAQQSAQPAQPANPADDPGVKAALSQLERSLTTRMAAIEQTMQQMAGLQAKIDSNKTEVDSRLAAAEARLDKLEGRLSKLESRADGTDKQLAGMAPPCSYTLTDISALALPDLQLPYYTNGVKAVGYGSAGVKVPGTGDTLETRLNNQELFQINTKGLPQLDPNDLTDGSLKVEMKLILTKNMHDAAPYDYTEILCSMGDKKACSGERFKDHNYSEYINHVSFWDNLAGKDVATSTFSDLLRAPDKADVRFNMTVNGVTYKAFKRTVTIDLGQAFNGQLRPYEMIYADDGTPRAMLPFEVADDIRLYDVALTISYKTKSNSCPR
jgi:hypothetical protein